MRKVPILSYSTYRNYYLFLSILLLYFVLPFICLSSYTLLLFCSLLCSYAHMPLICMLLYSYIFPHVFLLIYFSLCSMSVCRSPSPVCVSVSICICFCGYVSFSPAFTFTYALILLCVSSLMLFRLAILFYRAFVSANAITIFFTAWVEHGSIEVRAYGGQHKHRSLYAYVSTSGSYGWLPPPENITTTYIRGAFGRRSEEIPAAGIGYCIW